MKDPSHRYLLAYIRQANLDMFWGRQPDTVAQNWYEFKNQAKIGQDLGFPAFDPMGPFPRRYDPGMRAAVAVLMKAQRPGRHEAKVKFSAARKARSIHTNVFKASSVGHALSRFMRTDKRRSVVSLNPTDSEFFTMFTKGLEARIGQRVKRDRALDVATMMEMQNISDKRWDKAVEAGDVHWQYEIARWTSYFLITFCHSLRGWETVKAIRRQTMEQMVDQILATTLGVEPHVGVSLYGRFKGCGNSNSFLLCMIAGQTASGLAPVKWIKRLDSLMTIVGAQSDWLFQKANGTRVRMSDFNGQFYDYLYEIQGRDGQILIEDTCDVAEDFHLARSFRRGATTRAQLADVPADIVDWVNRWGTGTEILVKGPMRIIYSERKLMLDHFLKFSRAL